MKRYRVVIGRGYTTWCTAVSLEVAILWARQRYGHITQDLQVTEEQE